MKTLALLIMLASLQAGATWRVKACDYHVHGTQISDIYRDGYFDGSLELKKLSPTQFSGSTSLFGGYTLTVRAKIIERERVVVSQDVRTEFAKTLVSVRTFALPLKERPLKMNLGAKGPDTHAIEPAADKFVTVFDEANVSCLIDSESLGDKVFDLVE